MWMGWVSNSKHHRRSPLISSSHRLCSSFVRHCCEAVDVCTVDLELQFVRRTYGGGSYLLRRIRFINPSFYTVEQYFLKEEKLSRSLD